MGSNYLNVCDVARILGDSAIVVERNRKDAVREELYITTPEHWEKDDDNFILIDGWVKVVFGARRRNMPAK